MPREGIPLYRCSREEESGLVDDTPRSGRYERFVAVGGKTYANSGVPGTLYPIFMIEKGGRRDSAIVVQRLLYNRLWGRNLPNDYFLFET